MKYAKFLYTEMRFLYLRKFVYIELGGGGTLIEIVSCNSVKNGLICLYSSMYKFMCDNVYQHET